MRFSAQKTCKDLPAPRRIESPFMLFKANEMKKPAEGKKEIKDGCRKKNRDTRGPGRGRTGKRKT
jgi:hypothetical protein